MQSANIYLSDLSLTDERISPDNDELISISDIPNGIVKRFGSSTAVVELADLLSSWGLEHLISFFIDNDLYIEVLKRLTPKMAGKIFDHTNLSIGARIIFFHQWSEWISSVNNAEILPSKLEIKNQVNLNVFDENAQGSSSKILHLNTILNSNTYGKSVMDSFLKEKALNDNLRKLLLESIIQYCSHQNRDLTVGDCAVLTKQICEVFPGELASFYYVERKNAAPLGKLYNKFRNWKYGLNRKLSPDDSKKVKQNSYAVREDEEEHIRSLKNDAGAMMYNEKIIHWQACAATRMNLLQTAKSPKEFFDSWPQYKFPDGYRLIDSDFAFKFGARNSLVDNLPEFCSIMLNEIFPRHVKELTECGFNNFFDNIVKNKFNMAENSICASVIWLLPALLPRSRINKKVSKTENKKFFSVAEFQNAFLRVCATEAEYKQCYDSKVKAESCIAPFITLIGNFEEPQYFLIDFDNINYKLFSFARAVDICFKAYFLFDINFAEACEPQWIFLNKTFYKMESREKANPKLDSLYEEIKAAKTSNFI